MASLVALGRPAAGLAFAAAVGLVAACAGTPPTATPPPAKPTVAPAATAAPAATTAPAAATTPVAGATGAATAGAATKPAAASTGAASPAATAAANPTGAAGAATTSASPAAATKPAAAAGAASPAATGAAGGATPAAGATPTGATAAAATPAAASTSAAGTPAAASGTATAGRVLDIGGADFSFAAPDTFEGGLVTVRLRNTGQEPHHAQLARLKENVTLDQFLGELRKGEAGALPLIALEGGPAAIAPGGSAEVILDLKAGQYVLLCFIPSRDGVPHLAKGMVKPLRVSAPATTAAAAPPATRGSIAMKDFAFEMPETIPVGRNVYRVTSDGPAQPHEAAIVKLNDGKTAQDYQAFFSAPPAGPPPGTNVGGMQGLDKGSAGWVTVDLPAGNYALTCLIPDPASGKPHIALGMVKGFTVR